MAKKPKVFLGGTCNNSTWRDKLIPMLQIDYFNPVVDDWTPECQTEEIKQRENCDYCLYVITQITSVYSIAEVIDDSNKRPEKTIFCFVAMDYRIEYPGVNCPVDRDKITFSNKQIKHLTAVGDMVKRNGGKFFKSLNEVANFLNQ